MDELRQRLVDLIRERGETLKSASLAVGKNHAYIYQYIHMGKPRVLPEDVRYKLARFLRVDEKELRDGEISLGDTSPGFRPAYDIPRAQPKDLPILGRARMGYQGFFFEQGKVQELIERPAFLSGVPASFAIYAVGSSMEPRYYDGEILYVNPAKPPAKGDFVVVLLNDDNGFIKRLVDISDTDVTLEQLNPHDLINVPFAHIRHIYRIVGAHSR